MKRPDLPAEHCANQSVEEVRRMFVRHIAPELKTGSINARRAISELQTWREYHPEAFDDWEQLCWTYIEQPPQWVDWLIAGVKATSEKVTKADELVSAAKAAQPLAQHGGDRTIKPAEEQLANGQLKPADQLSSNSQERILRRLARDAPEIFERVKTGEFKSARAAAIEAGIIKDIPSVQLKDPAPTAQKLLAKKGQSWCLQLMEELSELIL